MTKTSYEATNSDVERSCKYCGGSGYFQIQKTHNKSPCPCQFCTEFFTPHHNGMMQLSNELAEMKRKCVDVPDGWELAPSRPSQRMLAAGYQAYMKGPHNGRFYRAYQAMLSAIGTIDGSE